MAIRNIVKIDEEKCNGCGLCVPACAEGAIKIVDGKARLIADNLCDGLGACLGDCPQGAINIIERDADEFDESEVEKHLASTTVEHNKPAAVKSNDVHGHHHGGGCPGSRAMELTKRTTNNSTSLSTNDIEIKIRPQLTQWPVQLSLVPVMAPYFENSDLLITADCVPFAYPNYHLDLLKDKKVVVGCPKLDDIQYYIDKLTDIISQNNIKSVTVAFMEVPCCGGMLRAAEESIRRSEKNVPLHRIRIGINGELTKMS
jgi:Fe-S-cluster-containing hydrogenase component 2